jgi:predicted nucleotidyltransferase
VQANLDTQDRVIVEHLRAVLPGIVAVYRFGSTAQGTATSTSDIDIAVLARSPVPPDVRFDVQEQLAAKLGRNVDLVDVTTTSPVMAIQILANGALLHEGDSAARGQFEDLMFSLYARLNEERRGILERVAAEGTVYGR